MFQHNLSKKGLLLFAISYVVVLISSFKVTQSLAFASHSNLKWAVLSDLIVIPFGLFYYLAGKSLSGLKLSLAFVLILRIAFFLIPSQLSFWPMLVILIESILFTTALFRIRYLIRTFKQYRKHQDFETSLTSTTNNVFGPKLAPFICSEILVIYYGLLGFRLKNDVGHDKKIITTHRKSAQTAIMFILIVVGCIETWAVHLLISKWSPGASYITSGISLYGLLFILADLFANIKRPSYLTGDTFKLRAGVRWKAGIPLSLIGEASIIKQSLKKDKHTLNASLLVIPNILFTFKKPIKIDGPYGVQRTVSRLSLFVDEPHEFIETVTQSINRTDTE